MNFWSTQHHSSVVLPETRGMKCKCKEDEWLPGACVEGHTRLALLSQLSLPATSTLVSTHWALFFALGIASKVPVKMHTHDLPKCNQLNHFTIREQATDLGTLPGVKFWPHKWEEPWRSYSASGSHLCSDEEDRGPKREGQCCSQDWVGGAEPGFWPHI